MRFLCLACLVIACGKQPAKPDRVAELEASLRRGGPESVAKAAAEYRELRGEHPDALRLIAGAYARTMNYQAEFELLRTIIVRGEGTTSEKLRLLHLARFVLENVDATLYATGLRWIDEALREEPSCRTFALLVHWTYDHPEHTAEVDRALAGCPRDHERASWFASRARQTKSVEDACNAVVHGDHDNELATRCAAEATGWKARFAKAALEKEPPADLLRAPEVTAHAMLWLAASPTTSKADACAALTRARAIETTWMPIAGSDLGIEIRYQELRKQKSCM